MSLPASLVPMILHSVTPHDAVFLWELACDPEARAQSIEPDAPSWREHQDWLTAFLAAKDQHGWIVLVHHEKAAFVHVRQISRSGGLLSVNVSRRYRGQGVGKTAIHHACTLIQGQKEWGLFAHIKPENTASIRAFEANGFLHVGHSIDRGVQVQVYAKG